MSQLHFSIEEHGYSKTEVDKYINMLQNEYTNAVEWSNEIERQFEEYRNSNTELEKLKKENEKLLGDCKLLASKLRSMNTSHEEISQSGIADAKEKSDEIIKDAQLRAKEIIDSAYKSQEQIISDISGSIIDSQAQLGVLAKEKESLSAEIEQLKSIKQNLADRIAKAQELLR